MFVLIKLKSLFLLLAVWDLVFHLYVLLRNAVSPHQNLFNLFEELTLYHNVSRILTVHTLRLSGGGSLTKLP
jgi:hypothetical protein